MKIKLLRQLSYMSRVIFYGLVIQMVIGNMLLAADLKTQIDSTSIVNIIVSIEAYDIPLEEIGLSTGFSYTYNSKLVNERQSIFVSVTKGSMADLLRDIPKESERKSKRVYGSIHIVKKNTSESADKESILPYQSKSIIGRIFSLEENMELPGMNVEIKGALQRTVSNINGDYSIDVADENSVLVVSSIGFLEARNNTVIDLSLVPDITALEEIVVLGYGSVKKADLMGAVSIISGTDIHKNTAVDPIVALQEKAAGLTITPISGQSGAEIQGLS